MCVTSAPANLTETIIGIFDIDHPDHGPIRVLSYKNCPESLSEEPNCMILPLDSGVLHPEHVLDTSNDPDFLNDYCEKLISKERDLDRSSLSKSISNYVFDMGVYTVIILNELTEEGLRECLERVDENIRPTISNELLEFYKTTYPDHRLVLACFSNQDAKKASPITVWFTPNHFEWVSFPTLDSHGEVPNTDEVIRYHQKIIYGTNVENPVVKSFDNVSDITENVSDHLIPYLPTWAFAYDCSRQRYKNKDLMVNILTLHETGKTSVGPSFLSEKLKVTA